jgi:hypothetical protein
MNLLLLFFRTSIVAAKQKKGAAFRPFVRFIFFIILTMAGTMTVVAAGYQYYGAIEVAKSK